MVADAGSTVVHSVLDDEKTNGHHSQTVDKWGWDWNTTCRKSISGKELPPKKRAPATPKPNEVGSQRATLKLMPQIPHKYRLTSCMGRPRLMQEIPQIDHAGSRAGLMSPNARAQRKAELKAKLVTNKVQQI